MSQNLPQQEQSTTVDGRRAETPKKQTVAFLKQFARAYFATPSHVGVVLN